MSPADRLQAHAEAQNPNARLAAEAGRNRAAACAAGLSADHLATIMEALSMRRGQLCMTPTVAPAARDAHVTRIDAALNALGAATAGSVAGFGQALQRSQA